MRNLLLAATLLSGCAPAMASPITPYQLEGVPPALGTDLTPECFDRDRIDKMLLPGTPHFAIKAADGVVIYYAVPDLSQSFLVAFDSSGCALKIQKGGPLVPLSTGDVQGDVL